MKKTCFATDTPELSEMDVFHYLISSMCVDPRDETVQIHSNGISDKARFSFNMFRFKDSYSYLYLHCEGILLYIIHCIIDYFSSNL